MGSRPLQAIRSNSVSPGIGQCGIYVHQTADSGPSGGDAGYNHPAVAVPDQYYIPQVIIGNQGADLVNMPKSDCHCARPSSVGAKTR